MNDIIWNDQVWTDQDTADTCEATAALLEDKGWTKRVWRTSSGKMCIEGALAAALRFNVDEIDEIGENTEGGLRSLLCHCPVYDAVLDTVNDRNARASDDDGQVRVCYGNGELPDWNDHDTTTLAEVLDVLHETAKRVLGVQP